ncbi:Cupredoxin [Macrophomina phaseolina]|nr:Cupredoxin [Macrophomina phaseolina]
MNLAVPRAALPFGSAGSPYNAFGRRSTYNVPNPLAKRTEHLKAAQTPGAGGVSAPADGAKVQVVQVGGSNGSLTFQPDDIKAEMGSFVQFQFNPKNHSVVQSTFDAPCMPMSVSMPNASTNAFFSGFMPAAAAGNGTKLTYTIQITDTKPIWFYCSQGKHCQSGMVGAINAASTGQKTLAGYKQLASVAAENLSPGQIPSAMSGNGTASSGGSAGGSTGSGAAGEGTAGSSGSAGSGTGTDTAAPAQQSTNDGARLVGNSAAGIVALGAAVFALL